jgi:hypothetical protein
MTLKLWTIPALCAGAAAIAIALGPPAPAQGPGCNNQGGATVCQTPGSASETAIPPQTSGGQNGSYGPSGDTPPSGGNGGNGNGQGNGQGHGSGH